ncbi:hypothetical protein DAPPUDRAFT_305588 [Daphnia pulex]|uniref:Uncharacterized protein n=1 Tax=Daphnia pulex TaxID=6669 RepID=E9FWH1_DAPPU|nr:hypothetical protein DAPPUDRAFT_305588 [Daphnia pulex]|eukprot:EFX87891.1 hypothetical protein DAPPUDRAFT_305588 [Daphnia pulex]
MDSSTSSWTKSILMQLRLRWTSLGLCSHAVVTNQYCMGLHKMSTLKNLLHTFKKKRMKKMSRPRKDLSTKMSLCSSSCSGQPFQKMHLRGFHSVHP